MKTTAKQPESSLVAQAKVNKQDSVNSILQRYKDKTVQRQSAEEEELLQGKFETTQFVSEEEELLQGKFERVQRMEIDEEELLQGKFETAQKMNLDEEKPIQGKFETTQLATEDEEEPLQRKPNNTGLPDNLKSGIENMSGYSMDDVKVHYNSSQPATLQAHAYAQGTDIHIAPGQEKHLPHEAWHVVQQKQGRVKPTMQMKGKVPVNDDAGLEKEADVMGAKAIQLAGNFSTDTKTSRETTKTIQRRVVFGKSDKPENAIIIEAWFPRPEGTSSSGAHVTAISLFQQIAMNAVINHTYRDALLNLREMVLALSELPGYAETVNPGIESLIEHINAAYSDDNPMNWNTNLDDIALSYILLREKVGNTHHLKGEGGSGNQGEGHSLSRLDAKVKKILKKEEVSEKNIAEDIMKMIDLRNVDKKSGEPHLVWERRILSYLIQHMTSIYQAYPILKGNLLLQGCIIRLTSDILGIGADRIFHVMSKMEFDDTVRREEDIIAELEQRFEIGQADGSNNECLLNTLVQQLSMNGVGEGEVNQASIHQFLVDGGIIKDGDMIDVYNINVTQAIAAQFNIRFQVHQVTNTGVILNHPVIGNGGPVIHILHRGVHFSPLFPH